MKKIHKFGLAALSGIAAGISWPYTGSQVWLIFIAFVPLLFVHDLQLSKQRKGEKAGIFWYAYLAFFIWNLISTWWVWNASAFGAVMAIICNALFMAVLFVLYHYTRKILGDFPAFAGLVMYWISWEYIHMDWDLTWPWLTLGNIFAQHPDWVQWYEFSGVLGGSIWIWMSNFILLQALRKYIAFRTPKASVKHGFYWVLTVTVPLVLSYVVKNGYVEEGRELTSVIVQPNIDPYKKFADYSSEEQVERIANMAREKIDEETDYLIAPETAVPSSFEESAFKRTKEFKYLDSLQKDFPDLNIVIGASTFYVYGSERPESPTARYSERNKVYYDYYNTAVHISNKGAVEYYHKSKLVPGVEMMPFPSVFRHFQDFAFNLGGTTGSLGRQDTRDVFKSELGVVAPVICYESVYGEYVGDYVKNEAEAIFIITNDGWWGDTPGYKQHNEYARLRAIEHRKDIARSANTGISCFMNALGEVSQPTPYWEDAVIKGTILLNVTKTFYTEYGDYLARVALIFSGFLLLLVFVRHKQRKGVDDE